MVAAGVRSCSISLTQQNTIVHGTTQFFFANYPDHPSQSFENHIDHPDGPAFCKEDSLLKTIFFANDIYLLHMPACFKEGCPVCTICLTLTGHRDCKLTQKYFLVNDSDHLSQICANVVDHPDGSAVCKEDNLLQMKLIICFKEGCPVC